jgi:predicted RND superfamily exporter protein
VLAQFKPIQYFGLLAGVTMLTASAADFLVLPACVASVNLWKPRGPEA